MKTNIELARAHGATEVTHGHRDDSGHKWVSLPSTYSLTPAQLDTYTEAVRADALAGSVQDEPTPEMIAAGSAAARTYFEQTGGNDPAVIYRAMRAAAPPAPIAAPVELVARVAEVHMSRYTLEWVNGPLPEGARLYATPTAQADSDALKTALSFAKGAIEQAIYTEDGLDGDAGQRVIHIIDEAVRHGTFDKTPYPKPSAQAERPESECYNSPDELHCEAWQDGGHCQYCGSPAMANAERNEQGMEPAEPVAPKSFDSLYKDNAQGVEIERLKLRIAELVQDRDELAEMNRHLREQNTAVDARCAELEVLPLRCISAGWRVHIADCQPPRLRLTIGVQSFDIAVDLVEDEPGRLEWFRSMLTNAMQNAAPQENKTVIRENLTTEFDGAPAEPPAANGLVAEHPYSLGARNDLLDELEDERLELKSRAQETTASIIGKAITWIHGERPGPAESVTQDITTLLRENELLRQHAAKQISDSTLMTGLSMSHGGINMDLEGGAASLLVESFVHQFKKSGGINYVELMFTSTEVMPGERFTVTLQRVNGLTPAQKLAAAEAELKTLKEARS